MQLSVVIAQLNPTVGAIADNTALALDVIRQAKSQGADLVIFPEMFITGYPTNDLLFEDGFVAENQAAVMDSVLPETDGIAVILGFVKRATYAPERYDPESPSLYNSAAVMANGRLLDVVNKTLLPSYDVFDEKRYFIPGNERNICPVRVPLKGREYKIGVQICEDLWDESYPVKVTRLLYGCGADFIVNISASPFYVGKGREREQLVREKIRECPVPFIYVNMVGGQDDLVFDGNSFAVDREAKVTARAAAFSEDVLSMTLDTDTWTAPAAPDAPYCREKEILDAHVLNLRDYFNKQKFFKSIVVGLSGGVDSAYTAYVAARAIGPEKVLCVALPSKYTTSASNEDARQCALNIGARFEIVTIKDMFDAGLKTFHDTFGDTPLGLAEENDQPRYRMMILMKISQKYGCLVCTTGNKSEISTGYFTMFGDGAGGKNVPGDLYKTELYDVVRYINRDKEIIPQAIIDKPPTAELRDNQKDTDSLPPYPVLDPILKLLVEERLSRVEIVSRGHDPALVEKIYRLYKISEFKRAQLPQGIKISKKAYGVGRRIPITNHWHG